MRYCARPCFALDRLSVLPDGRVAYRIKSGGRGSVLAPHSKWRSAVVPEPPTPAGEWALIDAA